MVFFCYPPSSSEAHAPKTPLHPAFDDELRDAGYDIAKRKDEYISNTPQNGQPEPKKRNIHFKNSFHWRTEY